MAGAICPQAFAEETSKFTSAEFLTWERGSQEFYIDASVGMAGLIITRNDATKGKCLDGWYLSDQDEVIDHILEVMEANPTFHPRGVLAAIIEKKCGSMEFDAN
ncbi:MAG: hypothetical protein AAGD92_15190 [Pseudomonadota bacterium]